PLPVSWRREICGGRLGRFDTGSFHTPLHHAYTASEGAPMRFLLTSAGIKNTSIHDALVDLLGKPIAESNALCIPTATHALGQPELAWRFISGQEPRTPMCELGWKSLGVLELTALPSID